MTFLPDVNVWLAIVVQNHPHNPLAATWFNSTVNRLWLCRITELGVLRLLTNSTVMEGAPNTPRQAMNSIEELLSDPRIRFLEEPLGFSQQWRAAAPQTPRGPNYWTDAYLISLCAAVDCTLVTFDRALARNSGPKIRLLLEN